MYLYLMRHGEAASPNIDPEQGLTTEGKGAIEIIAKDLLSRSVHVNQVFHSPKKRAKQTAQIVSSIIAPSLSTQTMDNLKPNDNPENLVNTINQWDIDTLVVSHLPFIPSLLRLLIQDVHQVPPFNPGTVVCLSHTESGWQLEWAIS